MKHSSFRLTALAALCLPAAVFTTQVMANDNAEHADGPATRFIIKYKETAGADISSALPQSVGQQIKAQRMAEKAQRFSSRAGENMRFVRGLGLDKHAVFRAERKLSKKETQRMLELLAQDDEVERVEEDVMLRATATPNDTQYSSQWHYYEATGGLRAPAAWDNATGQGVVVAVLDTGYRPHADLNANILPGYDMISDSFVGNDGNGRDSDARDPGDWTDAGECGNGYPPSFQGSSWHGTHVAGTIAAVTNNNNGVAGVAYNAKIVPVRVLGKCGGYTSDIADGIIWAAGGTVSGVPANANPADVINMSLGGGGACSSTTQNAINIARNNGAVVVIAAGNDNDNANNYNPGNCAGVVNVASTGRNGGRAYYSNYGTSIDVAAPGGAMNSANDPNGVLSTYNTGTTTPGSDSYGYSQGTSMAAPHVAGVAALIKQVKPSATPDEIEQILKSTARSFPAACSGCGTGIVDANAAVLNAMGSGGGGTPGTNVLEKGVTKTNLSGSTGSNTFYTITVPAGATNLTFNMAGGSGDADMYVKFGSAPTSSSYDCRPYRTGNTESCSFATPQAGTYHVMLNAYSAYSGISLTADYTAPTGGGSTGGGGTLTNLTATTGNWLHYTLTVPAGMGSLNVTMSGGTGDGDLYVRRGAQPTTSSYDCRPYKTGNNESCAFTNPQAATYHISIRAYSTFSGVTLVAEYKP
ncbi:S8 family peptidase [Rheinheimera nanhaiensis]|uniref:Serine protease n=1 Tax=Rheinheimera nanhaiensis E407-8 TaxID=562729 RepID=I1DUE7_9GAMM|nr:S8 family peptidase [Rheinheimera nanhaiensis]GAB57675.1 serine protease [Rheinheimera nanhaiensis E407-8]